MDIEKLDSSKNYCRRWTGLDITIIIVGIILLFGGYTTLIGIILLAVYPFCLKTVVVSDVNQIDNKIKVEKKDWKEYCTKNNISIFKQYGKNRTTHTESQANTKKVSNDPEKQAYLDLKDQFKKDDAIRSGRLFFDRKSKQLLVDKTLLKPYRLYKFSDIVNYKQNVVGSHVSKHHRVARGLAGGALLGGAGMVTGALTGGKEYDSISNMSIIIYFKDGSDHEETYLSADEKVGGVLYNLAVKDMNKLSAQLESILAENNNTANNTSQVQTREMSENAQKLRDLKALLDDGVITNEDFEARKKQILNL